MGTVRPPGKVAGKPPKKAVRLQGRTRAQPAAPARGTLARKPGEPLHHQLFVILRDQVTTGHYRAGDPLPSEEALSDTYGVSRSTARQALSTLRAEGLIVSRQGVGTFVGDNSQAVQMHMSMEGLEKYTSYIQRNMKIQLLELKYCAAPSHVERLFNAAPGSLFQRTHRVRLADDIPILYIVTFIPEAIARRFSEQEIRSTSFMELLKREGYKHESGRQTVSAVLAEPEIAAGLQVNVGDPVLQMRRVNIDKRSGPLEYMEIYSSPSRFEFEVTLDPSVTDFGTV